MSDAGEISAPLRKRPSKGTTKPDSHYVLRIPIFVVNSGPSSRVVKVAGSSGRVKGSTKSKSHLETMALWALKSHGIPDPELEAMFHPTRLWRFDFCWREQMVALEIEGGIWMAKSGHTGGTAITRDTEKYNEAQILGWTVLRATKAHIQTGQMVDWVKRALGG